MLGVKLSKRGAHTLKTVARVSSVGAPSKPSLSGSY